MSSEAIETLAQFDNDDERARVLVRGALNPHSPLRRDHSVDQLIAAAQVYATLATRA